LELKSDESESGGALASVLKALRKVHHIFFEVCILLSLVWLIKFFFFLFVFKVLLIGNLVAGIRRESGWQRCEKGKKG
jgi:hypothetical protein